MEKKPVYIVKAPDQDRAELLTTYEAFTDWVEKTASQFQTRMREVQVSVYFV